MSIDEALHLNPPETPSCLHGSQGLWKAPSCLSSEGAKMSSDRLRVCIDMNVLMDFLSREDQYFASRRKGPLLGNTSLTVSEKVALLNRKCSFGSICSINRNKEGRKEGRKERRGTWWMCH